MEWKKKIQMMTYEKVMSYGFFTILTIVFIFSFHKSKPFSDAENRNLQTFPDISIQKVIDQRFQKQFQNYRNDQFLYRDTWIYMKTKMDVILGKKEFNNVILGVGDQLFEKFIPTQDSLELQELLNTFAKTYNNQKISLMLVPNPIEVWKEKLPYGLVNDSQAKYLEELKENLDDKISWIDMLSVLNEHKEEYIYYRSDHHWTTLGAYYGFQAFADSKKIKVKEEDWEPTLISKSFYGTLAGKSGYLPKRADDIHAYLPSDDTIKYIVRYIEEEEKSTSIYKSENLENRDQYSVFLNGNHPLIEIDTTSKVDKRLLILKDSYANAMIPFLLPYYSKITVIDPRYYTDNIGDILKENLITDILLLYNVNTFYQDTSLSLLLQE